MSLERSYESLYIDGSWVEPTGRGSIDVVSPTTEEVLGSVPHASTVDVDRAVNAARVAFDQGPWPRMTVAERGEVLRRVRAELELLRDDFAELITDEMGCPITQAKAIQLGAPLGLIDAYLDVADHFPFRDVRITDSGSALVTKEPLGVVAAVVPWNVPLIAAIQKLAPALLAGCTVVFKPAPETPLSTLALAGLFHAAGLPRGVLNIVCAERDVSEYLVAHPSVDKVAFTGSTLAGRRIASICGHNLTRVTLELGGKSAAIVLRDADLDATVESLRLGSFRNNGQICSLKTRLIVPVELHDEFVDRMKGLVESMPVGDPRDPKTQIGPMVTRRQQTVVRDFIASGHAQGAEVVAGGASLVGLDTGWFVEPTVFSKVDSTMRIAQEEIFGPVVAILTYDSVDAAIQLANDSAYGLSGAVFGADEREALRVASQLRTGVVEINGNPVGLQAPVGGFKNSGIGREAGIEGMASYTETRSHGLRAEFARTLV
ncbi:aldehyde dehydrogenase [Phycicoccus sp. Soil802]|uniref:aldehyde dehydrogenase n=1 Tax=Phycicoccus sp. Soil802 TaxID=1736414 RepID=UPI0007027411|nr:aldehyde dehydrogenase [Phycicoccus sp. Soil802]KRF22400.1 aldehyde dehydrogenase [Phycicoccus sp. Soil802]